jgi:hypothetical protein
MNYPFAGFGADRSSDAAAAFSDGRVVDEPIDEAEAEAEAIFHANDEPGEKGPEWAARFLDTLTRYVLSGAEGHGHVSESRAQWLIDMLERHGHLSDPLEMTLLVKVISRSLALPPVLRLYALAQIEHAVVSGEGPLRDDIGPEQGVTAAEADLIRRLVSGGDGDGSLLSKAEAEMLFRIKDATVYEVNAPEWEDLFVRAIGGYLLGFDGPEPLTHARAVELEAFMANEGRGIGAFLARMGQSRDEESFASLLDLSIPVTSEAEPEEDDDGDASAYGLPAEESHWLQDQLDADEDLDPLEKALIAFIAG